MWDKPFEAGAPAKLDTVPPGQDVDIEGQGEILRIQSRPAARRTQDHRRSRHQPGQRRNFQDIAVMPYVVDMYGGTQEKKVAITFDDGPDPEWTPKILDVLKEKKPKRLSS